MGQSVIGALRVNLGLNSAKFERGAKRVKSPLAQMKKQFLAVAAVAAAAGGAISAMALAGARDLDRAAKSARRLGASIGGFRALELAAGEAGVSLSSMTNDIQTVDREIASIGKSGNAKRALDALGISAQQLSGADADEKLALIADRVKALGLSTGETSSILRDLGVRNREMVLLMLNGGDVIRSARRDIEDYGLAVSSVDAGQIEQANDRIARLGLVTQYLGQRLALEVVPALGQMALGITNSLRAGGALRGGLDGLASNVQRLTTYLAVAVTGFGVRYVAALVAAKVATATLAGSMVFLRGALIRTGIGALIVGAGELVYQFSRMVSGAGGFGEALKLLKDVASELWDRMSLGASSLGASLGATWDGISGGFLTMLQVLQNKWASFLRGLAETVKELPGFTPVYEGLVGATLKARYASMDSGDAAEGYFGSAASAQARADALAQAAKRPLSSMEALRAAIRANNEETEDGTTAADRLGDALGNLGGGATGGVRKAKDETEKLSEGLQSVKSSAKSAFAGLVTGAKSAKEALGEMLSSLATALANSAFNSLFGNAFDGLSGVLGFANGTLSAPGGLALVGERGPELVNLPRGAQVNTAQATRSMLGAAQNSLHVSVGVDDSGYLVPLIQSVSGNVSAQHVAAGMAMQDRKTSSNLATHLARKG
ncbi:hypothetical protein [Pseudophaeobacter flagellatus]|uniref:hypothetical protein n=1 Tax=Pseudophaeobacter flagellatus TaxID=2899119 RepID=UPI001E50281A|nr:hypothetical protein [Pseudophaeobacter flagellatus]MCD9148989.1 hypothetical protein [Pseudophaeobacter flagellatus]